MKKFINGYEGDRKGDERLQIANLSEGFKFKVCPLSLLCCKLETNCQLEWGFQVQNVPVEPIMLQTGNKLPT